ncbi:peptidoglycan-binding protein, partial [Streptomyces sp. CC77]|uniref:peptidoglycan-binding domain-containing protein n=1 Tax=Streptomyces sp. CC77 TaxID=1906739 RepID=UPI0008DDA3AA
GAAAHGDARSRGAAPAGSGPGPVHGDPVGACAGPPPALPPLPATAAAPAERGWEDAPVGPPAQGAYGADAGPMPPEAPTGVLPPVPPGATHAPSPPWYGRPGAEAYDIDGHTLALRLAQQDGGAGAGPDVTPGPRRARRRDNVRRPAAGGRGAVAAAGVAAVLAVIGTAAFVSGAFDADDSTADRVAPVPSLSVDQWPVDGSPSPSPETSSEGGDPDGSASPSPATSASASRAASGPAAASASVRTAPPVAAPAAPRDPVPARPDPGRETPAAPGKQTPTAGGSTLNLGDRGREVSELKHRLREAGAYGGPMHDRYDRDVERAVAAYQQREGVTGDPGGVYGPATRAALEGETAGRD